MSRCGVVLLAAAAGIQAPAPAWGQAEQAEPDSVVYRIVPESRFDVQTGRAGLFGFFGHEHLVRAGSFEGTVVYHPREISRSEVRLTVQMDSLRVLTDADSSDLRDIRSAMRNQVLKVDSFPTLSFHSTSVEPDGDRVRVTGALTLTGHTDTVAVQVAVRQQADTLWATGRFDILQTRFGIKPYKTALGTVQVADRVTFDFEAVAVQNR